MERQNEISQTPLTAALSYRIRERRSAPTSWLIGVRMSQAIAFPRLETVRLLLEPQTVVRFDEWYAMERARDEPGHVDLAEDDAWLRLCARQGMWAAFGHGFYFLHDRVTGAMVGEAGFQHRRRGLGPQFDRSPEISWAISRERQGVGLATEAVAAILDNLTRADLSGRVVALIARENVASRRLATRLGFTRFAEEKVGSVTHDLLEHNPRSEGNAL